MMTIGFGMKGEYKLRAINAKTGKTTRRTGWMKNLITDRGMDNFGNGVAGIGNICCVGVGNITPSFSDTALASFDQAKSSSDTSSVTNTGTSTYIQQLVNTYLFPVQVANKTYAEVGLGANTAGTNLFSRALIVDSGGAPTTFTVLVGERLEVTYRLWVYMQQTDVVTNVTISGTVYTLTHRGANIGSAYTGLPSFLSSTMQWTVGGGGNTNLTVYNGAVGASTTTPSGSSLIQSNPAAVAYTNGNFYRDISWVFSTTDGNLSGGITALQAIWGTTSGANFHRTQIGVSPAIPKDNTKSLTLVLRYTWARVP